MTTAGLAKSYFLIRISPNLADTHSVNAASVDLCVHVLALKTQVQGWTYGELQADISRTLEQG